MLLTFFISLGLFSTLLSRSLSIEYPTPPDGIMNDIERALEDVTNESREVMRDKIIPKLYNFKHQSRLVFKIPSKNHNEGYSMVSVERTEMTAPIFPNVTLNRREVSRKQRFIVENCKSVEENKRIVKQDDKIWSSLGLDGWEGELTDPSDVLETDFSREIITLHSKNNSKDLKPKLDPNQSIVASTQNAPDELSNENGITENLSHKNLSQNIYIARANDPFGVSTKWPFRNEIEKYPTEERMKRSVPELYSIIKCATGCEPLTYQGYGCYCGYQGDGIPVNGIDRCCKAHDRCYGNTNCPEYINYLVPYLWKCYYGKPVCALNHGLFGGPNSCAASLCYCDRMLAMCLRKFQCPRKKARCTTSLLRAIQYVIF